VTLLSLAAEVSWLQAIVLGIVQGLTEFLPISSTAHLLILSKVAGWGDPGAAFTAVTQIGTELAVIIYFRRDIVRIATAWLRSLRNADLRGSLDARMGWYVILGSLPILILGFLLRKQIETVARNLWLVALTLILFGVILGVCDALGRRVKQVDDLNARDGIVYGLGQALALIPGVSRSGATISAGLALGYTRESAARYSFLLAIPAVLASGLFEALQIGSDTTAAWGPTLLATAIAFVVGYLVIAWLLRYLVSNSFLPFVLYRIALGLVLIVLLLMGVVTAA